ncbi:MAG: calcium-binding protein, partial [Negativicutes bacterium]|nr:calcium-binding protein [Negativicutes bacterium]
DFSQFAATAGVNFSLQDSSTQNVGVGGFGTFSVENIERIVGTSFTDILEGKDSQSDTILAGAGNDTVFATSGNDVYDGGAGANTLDYSHYSGAITADLGLGEINGIATGYDQVSNFIHLIGSTGNDTFLGSVSANNTLDGSSGNDIIDGVGGNNTLVAGAGIDTLIARGGSDVYDGTGTGDDTVDYSNLAGPINIVLNSAGNATVNSGYSHTLTQIEHIIGTTGNDVIVGDTTSVNTIMGYDGNDTLQGGMGSADVLIGGTGDDTFLASSGGDSIDGSEGSNTLLYNTASVDAVVGSTGVYLDLSANRIYRDGFLTDLTQLNGFIDHIDTIQGSVHNDTIYGTSTDNLFYGNAGNDIIWGREGADTLYAGAGNDTLDGGEDNDTLYGQFGNNRLMGGSGDDTIIAGTGNDTLEGGAGADILDARMNGGNNTFIGGYGDDTLYGGAGKDTLNYQNAESAINVNLTSNSITSSTEGTDTLASHFEMIMGSNFSDTIDLRGAIASSTIVAGGGNDTLYDASTYNDTIFGGDANDVIYANSGNNSYYGGNATFDVNGNIIGSSASGDDRINYSLATSGINVNLSIVADASTYNVTSNGFSGQDKLYDITRITGSNFNDIIKGSSGWNEISAGGGDDWIIATNGGDTLRGGTNTAWNGTNTTGDWLSFQDIGSSIDATMTSGAITGGLGTTTIFEIENLFGSSTTDILRGDANNNTLHGNAGNDAIFGTAGSNFLIGGAGDDTLYTGSGVDRYDGGDVSIGTSYLSSGSNGTNTLSFYYTNGANVDLSANGGLGIVNNDGYGNTETYIRNINNLTGSLDYSDTLVGNSADNIISGLGGADVITGTGGENTLYGGTGNDIITAASTKNVGDRGDLVFGGEGTDTLSGSFNSAFLVGGTEAFADVEGDWINYSSMALNGSYGFSINLESTITFTDAGDRASMNGAYSQIFQLDSSGVATVNFDYARQIEHIIGSAGGDKLMGKHGENNTILAGNGDDTLFLSSGQNYLDGQGNTTLTGGGDWLSLQNMSGAISNFDLANNNAGDTKVYNVENVIDFDGVRGQTVWGTNSANIFIMYGGDDHVLGRSGNDVYDLGAGNDRAANNYGSDTLIGGSGTDTLDMYNNLGSSQGSTVILNNITAATYNNYATGYAPLGLSNLSVVTSNLAIAGLATLADGNYDFYRITDGRGFTDYLYKDGVNPDFEQFYLTNRNDTFVGSDNVDTVQGYEGNDLIFAGAGNDFIYGGSGDDTLFGVSGNNLLEGGSGNDTIFGGTGNDIIRGISGYNILYGKAGNNQIIGGTNDDIIFAGIGQDAIDGGTGTDTLKFDGGTQGVIVNLGSDIYSGLAAGSFINSHQSGGSNQTGTVVGIENVYGTSFGDTIRGSDARNELYGGSGDDTIVASLGNDEIHGDGGSDWLDFSLITTSAGVNVDLMTQNNAVFTSGSGYNQTLFGIENIVGTAQNDILKGGLEVNNTFIGDSGNDILYGIGGTNSLQGGIGDDTIFSGIGNDAIDGGDGTDTVDYSYSHNISVSVNLSGSTQSGILNNTAKTTSMTDTLISIENVTTSS